MLPTRTANRLAYLDWMRGFAVVVMIETHVFNSFVRMDLRKTDGYLISQWLGGLAAPLFLFIAGIMVAFRIEKRASQECGPVARLLDVWKRAGFVLLIAELILLQQWISQWNFPNWKYLLRVDILNCMALAIAVSGIVALGAPAKRPGFAILLGALIAGLAPVVCSLDWSVAPWLVRDYLVPGPRRFAFFPEAAYVPFGLAVGFTLRRAGTERLETAMTWMAFAGFFLLYAGEFAASQPYSLYSNSDFWVNSPVLIVIRTGIMALLLVISFLWTKFGFTVGIVRQLGMTSLLVYWVHIELVYGSWLSIWKRQLTIPQAAAAALLVTVLMYGLSIAKTKWSGVIWMGKRSRENASLNASVVKLS